MVFKWYAPTMSLFPNVPEMPFRHRIHSRPLSRFGWTYRALSNDHVSNTLSRSLETPMASSLMTSRKPRVVIVGAGFGGLSAAKALAGTAFDVTLIDRHNYHLFQPLLYQVATAGLSPADIAAPIRGILGGQKNITVVCGTVTAVDVDARRVIVDDRAIAYDALVLATGATHGYFGLDEWAAHAPGLKSVQDAT